MTHFTTTVQNLFFWSCGLSFDKILLRDKFDLLGFAVVPLLSFWYLTLFLWSNRPWNQLTLLPSDYEWRRPLTWRNIWRLFDKHAWQGFLTHDGKKTNLKTLMLIPLPATITLLQKNPSQCVTVSLFIKTNLSRSQLQFFKSNIGHRLLLVDEGGALKPSAYRWRRFLAMKNYKSVWQCCFSSTVFSGWMKLQELDERFFSMQMPLRLMITLRSSCLLM